MQSSRVDSPELSWRILRLLNLFRVLVALSIGPLYLLASGPLSVGSADPILMGEAAVLYLTGAVLSILALRYRLEPVVLTKYLPILMDIVAIAVLSYSSGGSRSGLVLLLFLPIGAISLLSTLRGALIVAATATMVLLISQVATYAYLAGTSPGFAQVGYYCAVLFLIATGASVLGSQLAESQATVRQRDIDLANLSELSEYIVQHLRESLIVVDPNDQIRLINESARELLGTNAITGALLGEISPRLLALTEQWRRDLQASTAYRPLLLAADGIREIEAHFAALGSTRPPPIVIFLEDTAALAERVQQSKLASLGRLSASLAHEVRTPVGAMSHAAQLLSESPGISHEDQRLTHIITNNAERISSIITNVQQLGRRENTKPEQVLLNDWLPGFMQELTATLQVPPERLITNSNGIAVEARIDPSHLRQILWNLCDNALRFSQTAEGFTPVALTLGRISGSGRPYLEVSDQGPGIEATLRERMFEPFVTGRTGGTGLGLFIARELAQSNRAVLLYEPGVKGGSIFRIVFSDPNRWDW